MLASLSAQFRSVASVTDCTHPVLAALWTHWDLARQATGGRPTRAAVDPLGLPAAAWRHCFLLDVGAEGFRVRLFGTFMVELAGCDPTGRMLFGRSAETETRGDGRVFTAVVRDGLPYVSRHALRGLGGAPDVPVMETLLLPLFDSTGGVSMIFGGSVLPGAPATIEASLQKQQAHLLFNRARSIQEPEEGRHLIAV